MTELLHANCVALRLSESTPWRGVLFFGPSGSGKSDLSLRLVQHYGPERAVLVADDYLYLGEENAALVVSVPDTIAGKMEVRGIGIVDMPYLERVAPSLVVQCVSAEHIERLPDAEMWGHPSFAAMHIPLVHLNSFEVSAPDKVMLAFQNVVGST